MPDNPRSVKQDVEREPDSPGRSYVPSPHRVTFQSDKPDIRTAHVYATSAVGMLATALGRLWFSDQDPLDPRVHLQQARRDIDKAIEALGGEEAGRPNAR